MMVKGLQYLEQWGLNVCLEIVCHGRLISVEVCYMEGGQMQEITASGKGQLQRGGSHRCSFMLQLYSN